MTGFNVSDEIVLVTGAASGIGLGIAQAFHAAGARVAVGDVNETAVAGALGREHSYSGALDVRDEGSVKDFFRAAEHALGPVTIVVANAGVFPNCPINGGAFAGRAYLPLNKPQQR